ncbi:DsrE family protein [Marinomonas algarum]|uniref:DsrE family protein n=1 Tax=Marinomonas algarum TaxID=2883105 RepID=A0A9X1LE27_9GAMM|nr:DsrE family protein [Marinomonas algarum]MCB5160798.1 DsrE family protein [Marinomonas algarum]
MKNTLIHLNSSPYTGLACKEGLDLALVLATFEQAVDLCVSGPALALLTLNQQPDALHGKNLHKLLEGLEFYDIDNVYIERSETEHPGAKNAELAQNTWSGVTALNTQQWQRLFSQYQQVFRF